MIALATGTSAALIPAIIGAVAALAAAVIGGLYLTRAQSAEDQRAQIKADLREAIRDAEDRIRDEIDQAVETGQRELKELLDARIRGVVIGEIVTKRLRAVLREFGLRPPDD